MRYDLWTESATTAWDISELHQLITCFISIGFAMKFFGSQSAFSVPFSLSPRNSNNGTVYDD
jgi:hypothetical protein